MTLQTNGHPAPSSSSEQSAPVVYQQLGLVAQELEHWEAAEVWHGEALRTAAELADYSACARACHQLSETFRSRGQLEQALVWSVLAFAAWDTGTDREGSERPADPIGLPPHLHLRTVDATWRGATGAGLPADLSQAVERLFASGVR